MALPNPNVSERRCSRCKATKPIADFALTAYRCHSCDVAYYAAKRAAKPPDAMREVDAITSAWGR